MSDIGDDDFHFPGGPTVEFWGLEVPPNKTVKARLSELPNMTEIAHVTSAALGEAATGGRHVVTIIPLTLEGKPRPAVALGTLERGRVDQFALDFGFSSSMAFRHSGPSTVFLSGYLTRSFGGFGDDDDDSDDDEEGSESEDDDDDDEAPQAVALQNGPASAKRVVPVKVPRPAAAAAAAAAGGGSDEYKSEEDEDFDEDGEDGEEDESEEEEDGDAQGDDFDRRLGAKSFDEGGSSSSGGGESDEGESDEGESEDGDPLDIDSDDAVFGVQYADVEAMDADGGSDSDDDEGESDEDESDEDEQQPAAAAAATPAKGKRAAQPLTPATQQPGKKQKAADGRPAAASAPARAAVPKTAAAAAAAAAPGAGSPEVAYRAALAAELRKAGGNMSLSALGSKVKKPEGVASKFKNFLLANGDAFAVNGDNVALNA